MHVMYVSWSRCDTEWEARDIYINAPKLLPQGRDLHGLLGFPAKIVNTTTGETIDTNLTLRQEVGLALWLEKQKKGITSC